MTDPNAYPNQSQPGAVPPNPPPIPPQNPSQPPQGYAAPPQGYQAPPPEYAAQPQGYPVQSQPYGYGGPGPYALPPSGRKFWALLFLFYIPYVGFIVTIIVSLVQRASAKSSPHAIERENARWAANWVLSYVLYFIVVIALLVVIGLGTTPPGGGDPSMLIAIPGILLIAVGIYCLVTMIRGTVRAGTAVHRPALAIPFFRA